ncbi:MAG: CPBP family intramembrane metalloprotease [Anaerolineales bacterium]|nr:CPBP family intramembrane metalloprotease [Anaerolineales bacterium]
MQIFDISTKIYFLLIIALAILGGLNIFLPQGAYSATLAQQQMPTSKPVMALATAGMLLVGYGGLGFLGLKLAQKIGFVKLWDPLVSNQQRFLIPALVGVGIGIVFIIADQVFSRLHSAGALPHPPFPTSLVASATAGIGEETIFRLFFVSLWVWLISHVIMKGNNQDQVFWIIAVLSALVFAGGHIPSVMYALGYESVKAIPVALLVEIFLLNGVLSILAAYYLRQYGFLAAVGVHFWADVVWHVVWGALSFR